MASLTHYLTLSIGKKQISAVTSVLLALFVFFHLAENYLLLYGAETFNGYVATLEALRYGLYAIEIALLLAFVLHIYAGIRVSLENLRTRRAAYAYGAPLLRGARGSAGPASKTMLITGVLMLVFLIVHLINFKFTYITGTQDMFSLVQALFRQPAYVFFYVFSVCMVGVHLSHGLQSAGLTLGLYHERYTPAAKRFSILFGVAVAAGYSLLPLFMYFR